MLQSKKKITGKAVLIFLICLTSVEGFIEISRRNGGEASNAETRSQQNQGSTYGNLKPSNNGQERRISQHIYDKRSFRTGSIEHQDTRAENLLATTREFRIQEDRRLAPPTYRLPTRLPFGDDTIRTTRNNLERISERVSIIEERRYADPSNNLERRVLSVTPRNVRETLTLERGGDNKFRGQVVDTSRRHFDGRRIDSRRIMLQKGDSSDKLETRDDAVRMSRTDNRRQIPKHSEISENRIPSSRSIERSRDSIDVRGTKKRDASSSQTNMRQDVRSAQHINRLSIRVLNTRGLEEREIAEKEAIRFSRSSRISNKLDTTKGDSREARNHDQQPTESLRRISSSRIHESVFSDDTRSPINRNNNFREAPEMDRRESRERYPERRITFKHSTDGTDRQIIPSEDIIRQSRTGDRRSIVALTARFSLDRLEDVRTDRTLNNNRRNIDVTNASRRRGRDTNYIHRNSLKDRTRRYQLARDRNTEIDNRQMSNSGRQINEMQFSNVDRSLELETSGDVPKQGLSRRDVPLISRHPGDKYRDITWQLSGAPLITRQSTEYFRRSEDTSRQFGRYRELADNRSRNSMRQSAGVRERNTIKSRDSVFGSPRQAPHHFTDRRNLQQKISSDDERGDMLKNSRQSQRSRIELSRLIRERNLNQRGNVQQDSRLLRDVHEDQSRVTRAGTSKQNHDLNLVDRRTSHWIPVVSREPQQNNFRESDQLEDSRLGLSRQNKVSTLLDRRTPSQNSKTRENRSRKSRQSNDMVFRPTEEIRLADRRTTQRSLDQSDYTRKIENTPRYRREVISDDRFNPRTVRQNFENHFRQTRNSRQNIRSYRFMQEIPLNRDRRFTGQFLSRNTREIEAFRNRRSERQYTVNIQSDDRRNTFRAISSGSDSPRSNNRIASNNLKTEFRNITTPGFGDTVQSLQQTYGYEVNFGVWIEAARIAFAVFLLGQIFVGSSDKYKLRVKNVISKLRFEKEKVQ